MPAPFTSSDLAMWSPISINENTTHFPYLPFDHPLLPLPPFCHPTENSRPLQEEYDAEDTIDTLTTPTFAKDAMAFIGSMLPPHSIPMTTECTSLPYTSRSTIVLTPCPFPTSDRPYPRFKPRPRRTLSTVTACSLLSRAGHWWKSLVQAKRRYIHPILHLPKRSSVHQQ
ncbi:hypothetical protein DM01DRAFT_326818 [Hesseltinella vesiculosa]|uniref:Uncharacterized protein n=1 Tax=Hesseltinella vesiculosa TaxID=101127 RepID=A0A1X2GGZ1_9FUNG|nr:hypothetical protein DM01DRAFT_326818 [Hesseltinella vesiculosa]